MSRRTTFHVLAEREIDEAVDYYSDVGGGLAEAFLAEIQRASDFLLEHPEAASLVGRSVRRITVHRFPYSLLYSLHGEEIRILAVAHQRRRPLYWQRRR